MSLPSRRVSTRKSVSGVAEAGPKAVLQPSPTLNTSRNTMGSGRPPPTPPLHRKYLRAFHDYQPAEPTLSGTAGGYSVTVPLTEGDLILVHLTHANGWADGTILQTGARGWIPTNFCQVYDHPFIRCLFHALTQLWDYLSSEGRGNAMMEERQDYVQGMIAGVRRLLEHCDCLHRYDDLIQAHIGMRRTRKSLLADLSSLIECRTAIQTTFSNAAEARASWCTDDHMSRAFKVCCRAVRFLDLWLQCDSGRLRTIAPSTKDVEAPLPSTTTASFSPTAPFHLRQRSRSDARPRGDGWPPVPKFDGLRSELDLTDSPPQSIGETNSTSSPSNQWDNAGRQRSHSTADIGLNMFPARGQRTSRLSLRQPSKSRQSAHTVGLPRKPFSGLGISLEEYNGPGTASEELTAAHDNLLGHIGAFLGLQLQSRTSLDLAATTRNSLSACTGLIAVVSEIWNSDPQRSQEVLHPILALKRELANLAEASEQLCTRTKPLTEVDLDEGRNVVAAATACVRCAGECTSKGRHLLDQLGDFQIDMAHVRQQQALLMVGSQHLESLRSVDEDAENEDTAWIPTEPVELDAADNEITGSSEASKLNPETGSVSESATMEAATELQNVMRENGPNRPRLTRSTTDNANNVILSEFAIPEVLDKRHSSSSRAPGVQITQELPLLKSTPKSMGSPMSPNSLLKSPWSGSAPPRKESIGISITESMSTYQNSFRNSVGSAMSGASTRATTPDRATSNQRLDPSSLRSFASLTSTCSAGTVITDEGSEGEGEREVLVKSYAHELLYSKEGQILGGSLRALVEKLTNQHTPPDPMLVSTFYLTFRLFTTASELAKALIDRYHYVGESKTESMPARLRIYNFMKGWVESHWYSETDSDALDLLREFALKTLQLQLPAAGLRLSDLVERASQQSITNALTQLVSPIGKTSVSLGVQYEKDDMPSTNVSKSQLALLRGARGVTPAFSIMDFDTIELARQLTLMQSRTFCAIEPEELLALEWTKSTPTAINVRSVARFSTDLTNFVADSILSQVEAVKRSKTLKHWIKIGKACLELNNYDSLMAIVCSLSSSTITRLKMTWDLVNNKHKAAFEELKGIVDVSRNYAGLRQRLASPNGPTLPFVGIYLTDLTFVDAGNQDSRILPASDDTVEPIEVINFDKHARTARIITNLQSFQAPYRLQQVPELQSWIQAQIARVGGDAECSVQSFWRRSLALEPRTETPVPAPARASTMNMEGFSKVPGDASDSKAGAGFGGNEKMGFKLGHKVSRSGLNGAFARDKGGFLSSLGFRTEGETKARILAQQAALQNGS